MKLRHDKVLHFLAGMAVFAVMAGIGLLCFPNEKVMAWGIGMAFVILAGCGKELYDGERADAMDYAATLFGGVVCAAVMAAIVLLT